MIKPSLNDLAGAFSLCQKISIHAPVEGVTLLLKDMQCPKKARKRKKPKKAVKT